MYFILNRISKNIEIGQQRRLSQPQPTGHVVEDRELLLWRPVVLPRVVPDV